MGAKVTLITINPDSPIAKMADVVIQINAVSPKSANQGISNLSSQWDPYLNNQKPYTWMLSL